MHKDINAIELEVIDRTKITNTYLEMGPEPPQPLPAIIS